MLFRKWMCHSNGPYDSEFAICNSVQPIQPRSLYYSHTIPSKQCDFNGDQIASFLGAIPSSLSLYANAPLMPPPLEGFLRLQYSKASGAGHTFLHGCTFAFVASSVFVNSGIFSRLMIDIRLVSCFIHICQHIWNDVAMLIVITNLPRWGLVRFATWRAIR